MVIDFTEDKSTDKYVALHYFMISLALLKICNWNDEFMDTFGYAFLVLLLNMNQ